VAGCLPFEQILTQAGLIDAHQMQSALGYQRQWGCPLSQAVVDLGFAAEPAVMAALAHHRGVQYREIGDQTVGAEIVRLVPEKLIRLRKVFPVALGTSPRGPLVLATADPLNLTVLDEVAFATAKTVEPVLTSERDVERAIERHLGVAGKDVRVRAPVSPSVGAPGDPRPAA
jgi:type IV pilus assembly protein PilB